LTAARGGAYRRPPAARLAGHYITFKPALAACDGLALLATLSATAITSGTDEPIPEPGAQQLSIADSGGVPGRGAGQAASARRR
jgi:hypothetical protein